MNSSVLHMEGIYMCICVYVCVCVCMYNEYIIHAFIIYFTSVYGSRVSGAHQKIGPRLNTCVCVLAAQSCLTLCDPMGTYPWL